MKEKVQVNFKYGIFDPSLEIQAKEQGYILQDADKYKKIKNAIYMCAFHVATYSQVDMMLRKLHKQVIKSLERINE